jgi:hypothetical protein
VHSPFTWIWIFQKALRIRGVFFSLALGCYIAPGVRAQGFEPAQAAGKEPTAFLVIPRGVANEIKFTAQDFATSGDRQWQILTLGQIAAATADEQTSLHNLHACPTCREIGISRLVVGEHPDAHKYILAGVVEIGIEMVVARYLRHHGPSQKWYWRSVWMLPQAISLYGHAHSGIHNAGID